MTDITDETVGITDVDTTPRDRQPAAYLSAEQHSFALAQQRARDARDARELAALTAHTAKRNRAAALLPPVTIDGKPHFATRCACGWHGLRVTDPEMARREFDAHPCAWLDASGRWEPGQTSKRTGDALPASWAAEAKAKLSASVAAEPLEVDGVPELVTTDVDGWGTRVKLIEVK